MKILFTFIAAAIIFYTGFFLTNLVIDVNLYQYFVIDCIITALTGLYIGIHKIIFSNKTDWEYEDR